MSDSDLPSAGETPSGGYPLRLEERQLALVEVLQEKDSRLAQMYESCLLLLNSFGHREQLALAAHALRELIEKTPEYLNFGGILRPQLRNESDKLVRSLDMFLAERKLNNLSPYEGEIDKELREYIQEGERFRDLLGNKYPTFGERTREVLTRFDSRGKELPNVLKDLGVAEWVSYFRYFTGVSHHADANREQFLSNLEGLERFLLYRLRAKTSEDFDALDALIKAGEEGVSRDLIDRVQAVIQVRTSNYEYFFEELNSAQWIVGLKEFTKLLDEAPEPIWEGDSCYCLRWPPSRYLARMAEADPENVISAMEGMAETENWLVRQDVVEAALKMPARVAVRVAGRVKGWLGEPFWPTFPGKVAKLCRLLADGGEEAAGLELARALLAVSPMGKIESGEAGKAAGSLPRVSRLDDYEYEKCARELTPMLGKARSGNGVRILADLLEEAIHIERETGGEGGDDDSWYWWEAVEEDSERRHGVKSLLVRSVRNAAEIGIKERPEEADGVLEVLRRRAYVIFDRMEIHLLRLFPEKREDRIAQIVCDRSRFEDYRIDHEYRLLVGERFGALSREEQARYLEFVAEEPDVGKEREEQQRWTGKAPTDEEIREGWRCRQVVRLWGLRDHLQGDWRKRYDELVEEFGEPETPSVRVRATGVMYGGVRSPKDADELRKMGIDKMIEYVGAWEPEPGDAFGPCKEGLAETVSEVVSNAVETFAEKAEAFEKTAPLYVASYLSGIEKGLKSGARFNWEPVLNLCMRVVTQATQHEEEGAEDDSNTGRHRWGLGRVLTLIAEGLNADEKGIPSQHRSLVWQIVAPLTEDADPSRERESEAPDHEEFDPYMTSINSIRGRAMHAVVRYALWIRNHLQEPDEGAKELGFDAMPEVREVLEKHLDLEQDASLAIRAMYGQWFPWLAGLDERWARSRVDTIFPADKELSSYREAAWEAYVRYCSVYNMVFALLRDVYLWAVGKLGREDAATRRGEEGRRKLAEHVMVLFGRGVVDENDDLLRGFWEHAGEEVRQHAIWFVAQSVGDNGGQPVPGEVLERFRRVFEERLEVAAGDPKDRARYRSELAAFAYWFISDNWDEEWSFGTLERVVGLTGGSVEQYESVLGKLKEVFDRQPVRSLVCLRRMIEGDKDGWGVTAWHEGIRSILKKGLGSEEPDVLGEAERIVDLLLEKGLRGFRDLGRAAKKGGDAVDSDG